MIQVDRPAIAHRKDVVLKVTSTAICGSDLHIYTGNFPRAAMACGDILGHEFMGEVFETGEDVKGTCMKWGLLSRGGGSSIAPLMQGA